MQQWHPRVERFKLHWNQNTKNSKKKNNVT
jgi:hypothetical protein